MRSIVQYLNSTEFPRVRVGIGKPLGNVDMITHVIGKVPKEDLDVLSEGTKKASKAVVEIINNGISFAMNKYN